MSAKILYATLKPISGQEQFIKTSLTEYALTVRKEEGNIRFEVYELDDGTIHIEEAYKDDEAFNIHTESSYFKGLGTTLSDKIEGGNLHVAFLKPVCTTIH